MLKRTVIRPINSLIFISDLNGARAPEWEKDRLILYNENCISVGCYPEQDGATELVLGDDRDVRCKGAPDFAGKLRTPSGVLLVSDVLQDPIFQMEVGRPSVTISIWLSHQKWPEKVVIGVGKDV